MALQAAAEKRDGLLVPAANAPEAAVVEGPQRHPHRQPRRGRRLPLRPARHRARSRVDLDEVFRQLSHTEDDFVDVKGQDYAKRRLLIAAAGSHNLLTLWSILPSTREPC